MLARLLASHSDIIALTLIGILIALHCKHAQVVITRERLFDVAIFQREYIKQFSYIRFDKRLDLRKVIKFLHGTHHIGAIKINALQYQND